MVCWKLDCNFPCQIQRHPRMSFTQKSLCELPLLWRVYLSHFPSFQATPVTAVLKVPGIRQLCPSSAPLHLAFWVSGYYVQHLFKVVFPEHPFENVARACFYSICLYLIESSHTEHCVKTVSISLLFMFFQQNAVPR